MAEITIKQVIYKATVGELKIPEFQREFVWTPKQVSDLADSLSKGFPVGCLVLWPDSVGQSSEWIVDGQQRVTALCIMNSQMPSWGTHDKWAVVLEQSRTFLNVTDRGDWSIGRKKRGALNIEMADILECEDEDALGDLITTTLDSPHGIRLTSDVRQALQTKAKDIYNIKSQEIPFVVIRDNDPLAVAEVYNRLNLLGTKIRETDTQLAFIAIKNEGWVKNDFRPFLDRLEKRGWDIGPGDALRAVAILHSGTPRVGSIPKEKQETFWKETPRMFEKLRTATEDLLERVGRYGIQSSKEVPSSYALVALMALHAQLRNSRGYNFDKVIRWFVAANLMGGYGILETLARDAKLIFGSETLDQLMAGIGIYQDAMDYGKTFTESFKNGSPQTMLLKMMLWDKALDWKRGGKLSTIPALEWHHIIPKKVCSNLGFQKGSENTIGNLTLLSEDANKAFGDQAPWIYGPKEIGDKARFASHWIPPEYVDKFMAGQVIASDSDYKTYLAQRAEALISAAKEYLDLPVRLEQIAR